MTRFLLALLVAAAPLLAPAKDAVPTEQDPVAAKRAVALSEQLRCLVCQNQSIAESNAELAVDLRRQINEQIASGRSDAEIVDFMVQRYGDFVLYRPPFKASTVLLWLGPAVLLVLGLWALRRVLRIRQRAGEERPLSEDDRARAERLLGGEPPK
ncbi:MAG TPA: cytochrome c-type biogenesis protein [Burkholderiales bacterium]|nr:cytochrome c-type biogenesis protein [Burkholderiales bacterium]